MRLFPTTQHRRWLLAAILAAGALLRLWLWWRVPDHQPANDETEYLQVARDLLDGRGWMFYERYDWLRAPLYSLWLAASLWLARGELLWAALPNIALSVVSIWLLYLLGCEVGRSGSGAEETPRAERVGLVAAALAAVLLTLATFSALWMSETLFTALFVAALLALLRWDRRPRPATAALAGVLLGLAILTRSSPLLWLPFVVIWLVAAGLAPAARFKIRASSSSTTALDSETERVGRPPAVVTGNSKPALRSAVVLVLGAVLVIAPWTLRNYLAYGAFIAVETGLSYNLWAFNEPREDQQTIFDTLRAIPNPATRADYATAKGLERLREDPAILLRKLWPNWAYLWRVKPVEDRFLQQTYYQDVPFGMFALGLVLDDALYYVIVLSALGGLVWSPNNRAKLLLGGWAAYVIAVMLLTHGESRYRHFVLPVLLPYAAWLLANLGALHRGREFRSPGRWAVALAGVALLIWPLTYLYPWSWAGRNLGRGWAVLGAEMALRADDPQRALQLYASAAEADPDSADVWLARGKLYQQLGQEQQALEAFEEAFARKRLYAPPNAARADSLRRLGRLDEAREAFRGFYTDEQDILDWSWQHLDTAAPSVLQIGDGLDFGFVGGMYAAEDAGERRARWSGPEAMLRLSAPQGGTLRLTLAAPRPDGAAVPVTVCIAGHACQEFIAGAEWRSYVLAAPPADELRVSVAAATFSPQDHDAQSSDERRLGVLIDQAWVE